MEHQEAEKNGHQPEFYYDVSSSQLLLGKVALDNHIESGGHPADVYRLGSLLRDEELEMGGVNDSMDTKQWTRTDFLSYGKWLINVVDPPTKPKSKTLNVKIVERAKKMGLGAGLDAIRSPHNFGSMRSYYDHLKLDNAQRIGTYKRKFEDWELNDFVNHIKKVARRLDKKPTKQDLYRMSRRNRKSPSPDIIARRYGGFRKVLEYAGFPDIHSWEREDFINWGVRCMLANDGKLPTVVMIDYLSSKKAGPGSPTVIRRFGKVRVFQEETALAYQKEVERRRQDREDKLNIIAKGIDSGSLPKELFDDVEDESEIIARYGKYLVVRKIGLSPRIDGIINMCASGKNGNGFVPAVKRYAIGLYGSVASYDAGEIETTAMALGVDEDIWPRDEFMQTLRIIDNQEYLQRAARKNRRKNLV
jgi:hypothetical protein